MNDGHEIPQLGFGVFQVPREETVGAVLHALKTGYRSIDTAAMYGNESEVAEAIARSELDRSEVFVTTKLWNSDQGRDRALRSFEGSLSRLGFDYVDLYLIHWPAPSLGLYVETWEAFTELQRDGRVRSIGVSNFTIEHLERIIDDSGVVPAANQIELHPQLQQVELRRFHSEHGIVTEAWSPLARGILAGNRSASGERLTARAQKDPFADQLTRALLARGLPCRCLPAQATPAGPDGCRTGPQGNLPMVAVITSGAAGTDETDLCRTLAAHPARHAHALEDP